MKKAFLTWAVCAAILLLNSCHMNVIDMSGGNDSISVVTSLSGYVENDPDALSGKRLVTLSDDVTLTGQQFTIEATVNNCVQTFMVADDDNVYMMLRTPTYEGQDLEINSYSTTLALVTMYPLFAPVKSADYDVLTELITSSPMFQPLYEEVERCVQSGRPIYDETNDMLLIAFSNLLEDICREVDEDEYNNAFANNLRALTDTAGGNRIKATYKDERMYPLYSEINGNVLTLCNTGLTPSYYGTILKPDGSLQNFQIPTRSDYGGLDLFLRTTGDINLGAPKEFTFTDDGNYVFDFSRMTAQAQADFFLRMANCLLSALGIEIESIVLEVGNAISEAILAAGLGTFAPDIEAMTWLGIAYDALLKCLQRDFWKEIGEDAVYYLGKIGAGSLNWYNKIKGIGNAAVRVGFALTAPPELHFCLCYNYGNVSACTVTQIIRVEGTNNQEGYPGQALMKPIQVLVHAYDEDNNLVENTYQKVKFEVVSGGGEVSASIVGTNENRFAETSWTLGSEGEQKVRAVVVDMVTEQEISDEVFFTATLKEEAALTVRLDWNKLSGNTDIDLHVTDPYGEEVYFANSTSASGGQLDRDDVVGPGPEHISWVSAPAGAYLVQVHYYGSETGAVTSYQVTIYANGQTFGPFTGSISDQQLVTIGTVNMPEATMTRSAAKPVFTEMNRVEHAPMYPEKKP